MQEESGVTLPTVAYLLLIYLISDVFNYSISIISQMNINIDTVTTVFVIFIIINTVLILQRATVLCGNN